MNPGGKAPAPITPETTVLDVVAANPATEAVFRALDERAGECVLCRALFETLEGLCLRYGLELDALLADLRVVEVASSRPGGARSQA